jgi:hypothetical protein
MPSTRLIKHEAVPKCDSYEVRCPDGRRSRFLLGQRCRPPYEARADDQRPGARRGQGVCPWPRATDDLGGTADTGSSVNSHHPHDLEAEMHQSEPGQVKIGSLGMGTLPFAALSSCIPPSKGCGVRPRCTFAPRTGVFHSGSVMKQFSMPYFRERSMVLWSFPFLIFLSGCSAKPECDSPETRNAVLQTILNDHNNPLVKYAARNSTTAKSSDASLESEKSKQRPLYLLGEKIVTTSTSEDKRTLTCSGPISVTVGDTKASKEVQFTVQQSPDGKLSVSVAPFQF